MEPRATSRAPSQPSGRRVVAFSLSPDINRLVKAGLVAPTGSTDPFTGDVPTRGRAVRLRQGNPKDMPQVG